MKGCSCSKCASLCHGSPGWFLPGQATEAAKSLGMTLHAFFDAYLVIEFWTSGHDIYVLAPRKVDQDGQKYATFADGLPGHNATCRLWSAARGCLLGFEERPAECATAYACKETNGLRREEISDAWRKDQSELKALFPTHDFE